MPVVIIYTQACAAVLKAALAMRYAGQGPPAAHAGPAAQAAAGSSGLAAPRASGAASRLAHHIRWTLGQYTAGLRLPDACREGDLRADLAVTLWRLSAVTAMLQAVATKEVLA